MLKLNYLLFLSLTVLLITAHAPSSHAETFVSFDSIIDGYYSEFDRDDLYCSWGNPYHVSKSKTTSLHAIKFNSNWGTLTRVDWVYCLTSTNLWDASVVPVDPPGDPHIPPDYDFQNMDYYFINHSAGWFIPNATHTQWNPFLHGIMTVGAGDSDFTISPGSSWIGTGFLEKKFFASSFSEGTWNYLNTLKWFVYSGAFYKVTYTYTPHDPGPPYPGEYSSDFPANVDDIVDDGGDEDEDNVTQWTDYGTEDDNMPFRYWDTTLEEYVNDSIDVPYIDLIDSEFGQLSDGVTNVLVRVHKFDYGDTAATDIDSNATVDNGNAYYDWLYNNYKNVINNWSIKKISTCTNDTNGSSYAYNDYAQTGDNKAKALLWIPVYEDSGNIHAVSNIYISELKTIVPSSDIEYTDVEVGDRLDDHKGNSWVVMSVHADGAATRIRFKNAMGGVYEFSRIYPGDYNGDGTVDQADYSTWCDTFGNVGPSDLQDNTSHPDYDPDADLRADGNGDGIIDSADFTTWADNFSEEGPVGSNALPIPDPAVTVYDEEDGIYYPVANFLTEGFGIYRRADVSYWSFDDYNDLGKDTGTENNDLAITGATYTSSGKVDGALYFDNLDYVTVTDYKGVTGSDPRTISVWIKTSNANGDTIFDWGDDASNGECWNLIVNSSGNLFLDVEGGFVLGSTDVDDGNWHHVAVVLPNVDSPTVNNIILYVDGSEETIAYVHNGTLTINTNNSNDVLIGKTPPGTNYFNGLIDEVHVYNHALSPYQIGILADQ